MADFLMEPYCLGQLCLERCPRTRSVSICSGGFFFGRGLQHARYVEHAPLEMSCCRLRQLGRQAIQRTQLGTESGPGALLVSSLRNCFSTFSNETTYLNGTHGIQIKSNQIKSNQIKSNQIKSNHFIVLKNDMHFTTHDHI